MLNFILQTQTIDLTSLLFGDRTVEQGRKAAREMQRGIDGIVVMLAGRVASKEEDAAGTMGRGLVGSALDQPLLT